MIEMDAIIYIQCDMRYNAYLLRTIQGETVVEHTIHNIRQMDGGKKMVSSLYDCAENRELGTVLQALGVEVRYSDEEHVNKRFMETVITRQEKYVFRVAGDQLLLNTRLTNMIIEAVERGDYEFFYAQSSVNAIVADLVRISTLREYYSDIIRAGRYFHSLCSDERIKRYSPCLPELFFSCRANSEEGFCFAKKIIENHLDILELQKNLIRNLNKSNSDLKKTGMWRSWLLGNVGDFFYDMDGCANPWWCESAVNLIKSKILQYPDIRVFEWGAGNSTLFWTNYAKEVVSVEHDRTWCEKMTALVPAIARIEYRELVYGGNYCKAILDEKGKFDIILIDGRDRVRCAKNCVCKLKENGIIIWDNTNREYYEEGFQYLISKGFRQLELSGIIWGLPGVRDYTSIFYRDNNMLGL